MILHTENPKYTTKKLANLVKFQGTKLIHRNLLYSYPLTTKKMATHSSILAWRIPGTEEPGGLPSMGSHRARHD